jgi:ornithine cyclodeaminase
MTAPLWLTEQDVCDVLDLRGAIGAIETTLRGEAAWTLEKTHARFGGHSTIHALGGGLGAPDVVGTKTWAHTSGGAEPLLVLWAGDDGHLLAVVEAFALGQLRTAAVSGVATASLAAAGARHAAILGTGRQARAQVAAVAAVRPLERLAVWGRDPVRRAAFADEVRDLGIGEVVAAGSVAEAVDGAEVITTATRSTEALLTSAMVGDGAHINAIGAITPERRELDAALVARCAPVVADSPSAAARLAAELDGVAGVRSLADAVSGRVPRSGAAPSLFKAMGIGVADVALGAEVYDKALAAGLGRPLPPRVSAIPRLISR